LYAGMIQDNGDVRWNYLSPVLQAAWLPKNHIRSRAEVEIRRWRNDGVIGSLSSSVERGGRRRKRVYPQATAVGPASDATDTR